MRRRARRKGLKLVLEEYKKKRNFIKTPEPPGEIKFIDDHSEFVIQKHQATSLHYDLRLEVGGVLKSWAVPKGPSLNPEDRRLAIMVEDHPYDYKSFEGVIPQDNYGAGTVMIWDRGTYATSGAKTKTENEQNANNGIEKGHLTFFLKGDKLKGEFALVKLRRSVEKNAWLLIKANDEFASKNNMLAQTKSVHSDRSMEEISRCEDKSWPQDDPNLDLSAVSTGDLPRFVKPMLATLISQPFNGDGWLFEIKWDGYRTIAQLERQNVLIYSRNNKSYNKKFPEIAEDLSLIRYDAVLDGEIVVINGKGKPDFNLIQNYPKSGGRAIYYVFDLLFINHHILYDETLLKRRQILKKILPRSSNIQFSDGIEREGIDFFQAALKEGLEGIVAKKMSSRYLPGVRSSHWLKIKTHLEQDAIIVGYTSDEGVRRGFGSLLLAVYDQDFLKFIGCVGTGFTDLDIAILQYRLEQLEQEEIPGRLINPPGIKSVRWVRLELICRIKFQEWTPDFKVRQAVYLGLREDIKVNEVSLEKPNKAKD